MNKYVRLMTPCLIFALVAPFMSSCSPKEEGVTLVEALKRYPMPNGTIETLVRKRIEAFKRQGKVPTETWTYQKITDNSYTIRAEIGLAGANRLLDTFQWNMTKKPVPPYIKKKPWVVSKTNPSAQKLMQ